MSTSTTTQEEVYPLASAATIQVFWSDINEAWYYSISIDDEEIDGGLCITTKANAFAMAEAQLKGLL